MPDETHTKDGRAEAERHGQRDEETGSPLMKPHVKMTPLQRRRIRSGKPGSSRELSEAERKLEDQKHQTMGARLMSRVSKLHGSEDDEAVTILKAARDTEYARRAQMRDHNAGTHVAPVHEHVDHTEVLYVDPKSLGKQSYDDLVDLRNAKFRDCDVETPLSPHSEQMRADFHEGKVASSGALWTQECEEDEGPPDSTHVQQQEYPLGVNDADYEAMLYASNPTVTDIAAGALQHLYPRKDDPALRYGIPALERFYNDA